MIFRAGFKSYEIQRAFELPKPLIFGSREEALTWLKQFAAPYPELVHRFREYVARFSDNLEGFRMTDQDTLERLAELLWSRKAVIVVREEQGAGAPSSKTPPNPAAFPLSERTPRKYTVSNQVLPAEDPPTLDPRVDAVAQAAALVAAAHEERAFCPE